MRIISILFILFMISSAGCGNLFYGLPLLGPQELKIVDTYPLDGAEDVSLDTPIVITFNKDLDESSVNSDTLIVTKKTGEVVTVAGEIIFQSKNVIIFDPEYSSAMDPLVEYSVNISDEIKDTENLNLESEYSFKFKTCPPEKPVVISTDPIDGATDVSIYSVIKINFSKDMDAPSFDETTFTVTKTDFDITVTGDISVQNSNVIYFDPEGVSNMDYNTNYKVTITGGVRDTENINLESEYSFKFKTCPPVPPVPSEIINTNPIGGETDVALGKAVDVTFSKEMDTLSFDSSTVIVTKAGSNNPVNCDLSFNEAKTVLSIDPENSSEMEPLKEYTVTITDGVIDADGVHPESNYTFSFTTRDRELPVATGSDPADLSDDVPVNKLITVTFNNLLDTATVNSTTSFIVTRGEFDTPVSGGFSFEPYKIIFDPEVASNMEQKTIYNVKVTTDVKDIYNKNLVSEYQFSFETADNDTAPPEIISTEPSVYFYDVEHFTATAVFSECIDSEVPDINDLFKLFMITDNGEQYINGSAIYNSEKMTAIFTPENQLEELKTYKAYIYKGIKDCSSNKNEMGAETTWSFRHLKTFSLPCMIPGVNIDCDCK